MLDASVSIVAAPRGLAVLGMPRLMRGCGGSATHSPSLSEPDPEPPACHLVGECEGTATGMRLKGSDADLSCAPGFARSLECGERERPGEEEEGEDKGAAAGLRVGSGCDDERRIPPSEPPCNSGRRRGCNLLGLVSFAARHAVAAAATSAVPRWDKRRSALEATGEAIGREELKEAPLSSIYIL